jgi:hypothetical protein
MYYVVHIQIHLLFLKKYNTDFKTVSHVCLQTRNFFHIKDMVSKNELLGHKSQTTVDMCM